MMRKTFGRMLAAATVLVPLAVASPAMAKDLSIKAFQGLWKGSAVSESEVSSHFRVTARDLDVEIRPFAVGGFSLRWSTVLRQAGDPNAPKEELKQAAVAFIPDPTRSNVWREDRTVDPMSGEAVHWARISDQTLTVYSLGVREDGKADLQVYDRTLSALGMKLKFTRLIDGEEVRSASGQLVKHAN
ncbi:MAG: hypothetical protein P1U37_12685 [Minwuia sp.]|nr:hypothetical protein [Minwuia sp.]